MKLISLIGLLVSLALPYTHAQAVLNVTGNTLISSNLVVEYAVGEVATTTIQNTVTQGVLQPLVPREPWVVTDTDDLFDAQYGFRAYPNPATQAINVETTYTDFGTYQILDMTGRIIQTQFFDYANIPVYQLNDGMYIIKILSKDHLLTKSFKIIKQ